ETLWCLKPDVAREIRWAKQYLKKNDRITWYLRWWRLNREQLVVEHLKPDNKEEAAQWINLLKKDIASYNAKSKIKIDQTTIRQMNTNIKGQLEHFFSLQDHEIENFQMGYETPEQVMTRLEHIESEIREK